MLFGCAAKPRGEKLFGFSPSYSHYCRLFDSFSRRTPKGVRRLILSPVGGGVVCSLPPSVSLFLWSRRRETVPTRPSFPRPARPWEKIFLRFLKKQLTSVFFFDKIAKPWPSGSVG